MTKMIDLFLSDRETLKGWMTGNRTFSTKKGLSRKNFPMSIFPFRNI